MTSEYEYKLVHKCFIQTHLQMLSFQHLDSEQTFASRDKEYGVTFQ